MNSIAQSPGPSYKLGDGSRFPLVKIFVFLGIIGVIEYFLYFREISHFFQADSIHWLYHRATSWQDFGGGFLVRDISNWYRPLGNRLIPFLFFEWFGMDPIGYRVVIAILFFIDTVVVFAFLYFLTRNKIVAFAGTFFFAIHTVNAIVTYDLAFAPELLSAFFYISSVLLFGMYWRTKRRFVLVASCIGYICGLCSKESAVALPFVLIFVATLASEEGFSWKKISGGFLAAKWHFLILVAYLLFAIGHLHVAGVSIDSLIKAPPSANGPSYFLSFGTWVFRNFDYALSWAFNIPRGGIGMWRAIPASYVAFLKAFQIVVGILCLAAIFNFRRRWLLLGISWFVVALGPSLLLRDHFLSYYLFVPLLGIALCIGTVTDLFLEFLNHFNRRLRVAGRSFLFLIAIVLLFVCGTSIQNERRNSEWLGRSSNCAESSINKMRVLYPQLKPNTTIYIINNDKPDLDWHYAGEGLFRLFYNEDKLQVLYSKKDELIPTDSREPLLIFKYANGHLQDETGAFQSDPLKYRQFMESSGDKSCVLQLTPNDIVAGKGSAVLSIPGLQRARVCIYYIFNNGPREEWTIQLDSKAQLRFEVTAESRKGQYKLLAFRVEGKSEIFKADAAITVR
jgi:hypothetical protein